MAEEKASLVKPLLFIGGIIASILLIAFVSDYLHVDPFKKSLHASHSAIEKCQLCHHPLKKVMPMNCARSGCHTTTKFRKKSEKTKSLLVQHARHKECLACHTEHKGKSAQITFSFDHSELEPGKRCGSCHLIPRQHEEAGGEDCGGCHEVGKFAIMSARE